jgi:hypothetical protein
MEKTHVPLSNDPSFGMQTIVIIAVQRFLREMAFSSGQASGTSLCSRFLAATLIVLRLWGP